MNKATLFAISAAVIVVGAGAYFFMNKTDGGAATGDTSSESKKMSPKFTGSFTDLAARGGQWKCTIDAQADTGAGSAVSSGAVYVSGERVRGDFTSTVQGVGAVDSHMIVSDGYVYTWSSMMPQGIKVKATASGSGSGSTSGQAMDANQNYSYDCQPSQVDASLFVVPTSVSFMAL